MTQIYETPQYTPIEAAHFFTTRLLNQGLNISSLQHNLLSAGQLYGYSQLSTGVTTNLALFVGQFPLVVLPVIMVNSECLFTVYEAPQFSASGTAGTIVNLNRAHSNLPVTTATKSVTVSNYGTELDKFLLRANKIGQTNPEYVLAPNTIYLFDLSDNAGVARAGLNLLINLRLYEDRD